MQMLKKSCTSLLGFSLLTSLTSCATIINGTHQKVGIASNPSNALIWVDRTYIGNTPMIVEMSRKDSHIVTIQLDGYQVYEATFSKQLSGWVFGNIVFGGIIGLAVDALSGGIYKLTPEQVQAELRSNNMTYSKQSKESCVFIVLKPDPSWQQIGTLVSSQ